MSTPQDAAVATFLDEARELLEGLEESLLALEADPGNTDTVAGAFRAMHTVKGSGAMFGYDEVARVTHEAETAFDRVRNGEMAVDTELIALTLRLKDHLLALLDQGPEPGAEQRAASDELIAGFRALRGGAAGEAPDAGAEPAAASGPADPAPAGPKELFWVRFRPDPDTFLAGADPLGLLEELGELGALDSVFHPKELPELQELVPERAYGWWDLLLCTDRGEDAVRDVFIFEDEERAHVHKVGDGAVRRSDLAPLLGLFGGGSETRDHAAIARDLEQVLHEIFARREQDAAKARAGAAAQPAGGGSSSIRVDSRRLDGLVDMVGELVILQARLTQTARQRKGDPVLAQIAEDLERLSDEMRDSALNMRMLPIGTAFGQFRRLVRDLSSQLGKDVELVTEGAETELDKTVIDRLKDPLLHILRNAVDHGVEPPEARERAGKPARGTVTLRAEYSSGGVSISVSDDGAGMDPQRVLAKARERGLVGPGEELSDTEALNLLFEAGFSTAEQVTDVSGRGVGMDVVKRGIDALRGKIDIDSTPGKGSEIRIRLPLTLAIIDGLHVTVGGESFIIPLAAVEACQERFLTDGGPVKELDVVERRGRMVPCLSLRRLLDVPGEQPDYERVVVAGVDGQTVGLAVDCVVGRQQAVIKSLGEAYKDLDWFSGTTINGSGSVSLILDVAQVVRHAAKLEGRNQGGLV